MARGYGRDTDGGDSQGRSILLAAPADVETFPFVGYGYQVTGAPADASAVVIDSTANVDILDAVNPYRDADTLRGAFDYRHWEGRGEEAPVGVSYTFDGNLDYTLQQHLDGVSAQSNIIILKSGAVGSGYAATRGLRNCTIDGGSYQVGLETRLLTQVAPKEYCVENRRATGAHSSGWDFTNCNNVVIKNVRFGGGYDAMNLINCDKVYFKNCYFTNSQDETIGIIGHATNVTFDRCVFASPMHDGYHNTLARHGKLILAGPEAQFSPSTDTMRATVTFYRCLIAHTIGRGPLISPAPSTIGDPVQPEADMKFVFVNCVWYNNWYHFQINDSISSGDNNVSVTALVNCEFREGHDSHAADPPLADAAITYFADRHKVLLHNDAETRAVLALIGTSRVRSFKDRAGSSDFGNGVTRLGSGGNFSADDVVKDSDGLAKGYETTWAGIGLAYPDPTIPDIVMDADDVWATIKDEVGCTSKTADEQAQIDDVSNWTGYAGRLGARYDLEDDNPTKVDSV